MIAVSPVLDQLIVLGQEYVAEQNSLLSKGSNPMDETHVTSAPTHIHTQTTQLHSIDGPAPTLLLFMKTVAKSHGIIMSGLTCVWQT